MPDSSDDRSSREVNSLGHDSLVEGLQILSGTTPSGQHDGIHAPLGRVGIQIRE